MMVRKSSQTPDPCATSSKNVIGATEHAVCVQCLVVQTASHGRCATGRSEIGLCVHGVVLLDCNPAWEITQTKARKRRGTEVLWKSDVDTEQVCSRTWRRLGAGVAGCRLSEDRPRVGGACFFSLRALRLLNLTSAAASPAVFHLFRPRVEAPIGSQHLVSTHHHAGRSLLRGARAAMPPPDHPQPLAVGACAVPGERARNTSARGSKPED